MELSFFARIRLFQKIAMAILITFTLVMVLVIIVAYSRPSGRTGLDPAQIQQLRYDFQRKAIESHVPSEP